MTKNKPPVGRTRPLSGRGGGGRLLFRDRKLLLWYQGGVETTSWNGAPREEYIWRRPQDVTLEPGHEYCEAAVYTDEYGRQRVYPGSGLAFDELDGHWQPSSPYADSLTDWEF